MKELTDTELAKRRIKFDIHGYRDPNTFGKLTAIARVCGLHLVDDGVFAIYTGPVNAKRACLFCIEALGFRLSWETYESSIFIEDPDLRRPGGE